jgi:hypothetical protein
MKKDKSTKSVVSKKTDSVVPIGDPRVEQPHEQRADQPVPIKPDWHRYADSRLKQFCCR